MAKLDKGGRAGRLVDKQRRPIIERRSEGDRIGAVDGRLGARRPSSAPVRLSRRRRLGRPRPGDADSSRVRRSCSSPSARTARSRRSSARSAKIVEGSVEAKLGDPASGVAMDRGRSRRSHERLSVADNPSRPQGGQIVHEMGKTARTFSVRICGDSRSRQRQRRLLACAGGVDRARGEIGRLLETEAPRHSERGLRALLGLDAGVDILHERDNARFHRDVKRSSRAIPRARRL